MLDFRKTLPAYKMRNDIVNMIESNRVTLISGETGCGKTTQVVQFVLDHYIKQKLGSTCHIICTQPRRISATSVAQRVASERDEELGKSCGYKIRLESMPPRKRGSVLFVTLGVLIRFLISDRYIMRASHIIIDEIHERNALSDFLLIIIKFILKKRPKLRVVLMSATLNTNLFTRYFGKCALLNIPGCTHSVEEYFLEDILSDIHFEVPKENEDRLKRKQ